MTPAISQLYPIENISAYIPTPSSPPTLSPHSLPRNRQNHPYSTVPSNPVRPRRSRGRPQTHQRLPPREVGIFQAQKRRRLAGHRPGLQICRGDLLHCSLQNLSVLPKSTQLQDMRSAHASRLFPLLWKVSANPLTKRCVMWPTVVAGMEAVHSSQAIRSSIENQLFEMSGDMGTFTPLAARSLLRRFWDSGKTGWDDCFAGTCV